MPLGNDVTLIGSNYRNAAPARRRGPYRPERPRLELACDHCGTMFKAKRITSRYCSPACKQAAYRDRSTWSAEDLARGWK